MNTGEAEPSSGLNGRLRPRKSNIPIPKTAKTTSKPDAKPAADKPKRTNTQSKTSSNKSDDLTEKADSPVAQTLCPYCDKTFTAKRALAKHVRRAHLPPPGPGSVLTCLFCNYAATDAPDVIRHMVDNHPNQYFACYDCHTRFPSTTELAEHKLNVCEKQKLPYRNKLRQKVTPKKSQKKTNISGQNDFENDAKDFPEEHGFNGIVISCELKSSQPPDLADIEENITTNFILPPGKSLVNGTVIDKNAVIILDELQWSKRIPPNFSFQNTDADQILSRLGVVHRSPRAGESHGREWLKNNDDLHQKFEKCFDTKFYSKVASNVQENLTKFLDGSFNFNPDAENTIKTRKAKNIAAINTVEGFPILLACEQFSRHDDAYMPRAVAPKHKWKWDNLESDKSPMSPEQIKRDSHTNNCIISLVSSLDIWTQLCMRRKFETKFNKSPIQNKIDKQSVIGEELKEILESRELPASRSQVVKFTAPAVPPSSSTAEFPASLGLMPTAPTFDLKPAVLSGEWVRPRCYVCCACGAQIGDGKGLSTHISSQHPNAQIQHYEIVGDVLLKSDILKHLYVPPSQMYNRTRPLRGFRECTKCNKSITLEDLHQHMLDCAGDTPAVRNSRKCRHRLFGVRKRRTRLPDNTIRKKIRKEVRTQHNRKAHMLPRSRPRTEVGDAETIRKMLADLPAKRHRVMVKPLNPTMRPRRNLRKSRNKIVMRKKMTEEAQNSQGENSSQKDTPSVNSERNMKGSRNPDVRPSRKPFKRNVKCVASKLLPKKDTFTQKSVSKLKRQIAQQKDSEGHVPPFEENPSPESTKGDIPVEQLSRQNNSERINLNAGPANAREHGDRSNNNDNGGNQDPGGNFDEHNGARDDPPRAPSPNAPLKHSIASLTASSDTQDRAVQFHHMFLIQQECYNLNEHPSAEQRMLFENEAVVTKLDKPPLHFNQRRPLDLQTVQKNKLLKPKKGLNDCIAMLKNKLVEPEASPPTMPGHVSVQCGNDEPLDTEPTTIESAVVKTCLVNPNTEEPAVVERRHSTTEINTDFAQRSASMLPPAPKKPAQDNVKSVTTKSRPRRSSSTRPTQGSRTGRTADSLTNQELLKWKQFYYDTQIMTAQSITENYTKRESSRRRNSLVPTEDLLLQHALNLNLLSQSNDLSKLADYPYPSASTYQQLTRKNSRRDTQKSKTTANVQPTRSRAKDTTTRGKNVTKLSSAPTKPSQRSKSVINTAPTKANNNRQNGKSTRLRNTATTIEKIIDPYLQADLSEDTSATLNIEKVVSSTSVPGHHSQNFNRNMPLVEYASNNPTLYPMPVEVPLAPLDLTNKISSQEGLVQYITQEQYSATECETYETSDSLNQNLANLPLEANTQLSNEEEVVDLRINNSTRASFESRYTPMAPELVTDEVEEENATNLCFRSGDDFPTDLSMNRLKYSTSTNSYGKPTESHNQLPTNYVRDFSNPIIHNDRCIVVNEYYDENSQRIVVVENEVPADWSDRRSATRSNMRDMEETMLLNVYTNNAEPDDENGPADLTRRSMPSVRSTPVINNSSCSYDSYDSQRAPHYANTGQIINYHYDRPLRTPSETNFTSSSNRTATSYCELLDQFEPNPNEFTATRGLSINDTTSNKSTNYEQLDYSRSEFPLSLVSNSVIESTRSSSRTKSNATEYEMKTTDYTLSNEYISVEKPEPTYSRTLVSTNANTNLGDKSIDAQAETVIHEHSPKISEKRNTTSSTEIKTTESKTVNNITTTIESTVKIDKDKIEPSKTVNSDQDAETARKIAMLPKELVEILGTMPVDHRNQLLKVLPQYVSTSTSPLSNSNSAESVKCRSGTASENLVTTTKPVNQDEKEFLFESNSEDAQTYKNIQFTESSTISVSSSILLTPPTPKLSERYSLQSSENNDTLPYTRKSRASTDEQTPAALKVDSNKLSASPILSAEKLIKNTVEYSDTDKIIDLTVDENSSENRDMITNMETVIHTHVVTATTTDVTKTAVIAKSNVQKTSNDKTASLRAVRIKTPSKRHHSVVAENTEANTQTINSFSINDTCKDQDDTSKDFHNISPMDIQKADVSSSDHHADLSTSQTPIMSPMEEIQKATEEKVIVLKNREDKACTEADKLNLVTSTIVRDMNSNLNKACSTDVSKSSLSENPLEAVNVSPLKKPGVDSDVNGETKTNNDEFTNKIVAIEKQPSFNTLPKKSSLINNEDSQFWTENATTDKHALYDTPPQEPSLIEDEDSEDDVSLAVILKQKQKDLNSVTDAQNITQIDEKNKESTKNKKKQKTKKRNKTGELPSSNKKNCTSKIKTKGTVSEIGNDCVSNESNLMDKRACGKKNAKKCRRLHHVQNMNYSDSKDQTNNTNDNENEINKENSVSSDKVKKLGSPEESFKVKTIDQDPDRSCSVNTVVNTDKNNKNTLSPPAMKDKSVKILEIETESGKSSDDISENTLDIEKFPVINNQIQCNLPHSSINSSCDENVVPEFHECSEIEKISRSSEDVPNISNEIMNSKVETLKLSNMSETEKPIDVDVEKSKKSKKDSAKLCPATNVNFESEDTNVTPLRRSRRGKSLFIASHSTVSLNPVSQDSEQRAPLTKKQLIFSKLLQDEENHNKTSVITTLELVEENLSKPSINTHDTVDIEDIRNVRKKSLDTNLKFDEETQQKQSSVTILNEENVAISDTLNSEHLEINTKPPLENMSVDKEPLSTENIKTNKRKVSQPKTKSKKKKTFEIHAASKNVDIFVQQNKCTENKEIQSNVETKESVSHDESIHTIPSKNECNTKVVDEHLNEENPEYIKTPTGFDLADINAKLVTTGKRKSCSPPRQNSLQNPKLKKCKLQNESKSIAKQIAPRNNTCYNKPARRARSKSVVVKSSSAEWYDPYDIDLEDMVDKTEPFVRKEVSAKMSFSSFKSSIAAKTRQLSKTAPSAVINILPSDADISTCHEHIKTDPDRNSGKVDCANENMVDRKVNDLFNTKDDISDSDESTKSDVPLKRYAEEKEKKLSEISQRKVLKSSDSTNESNEKMRDKTKSRKKNNRSVSTSKKEEEIAIDKVDSEKDLRSEQFMESFGFFSERKPRKSNLLATKKISETFHIIANDSDDVYFASKERSSKKGSADNKKDDSKNLKGSSSSVTKKAVSRSRKKKSTTPIEPPFCHKSEDQLEMLEKSIPADGSEIKQDEDLDSITAKNIMDSEEVRNLENDLISNLKEASGFAGLRLQSTEELTHNVSEAPACSSNYEKDVKFDAVEDAVPTKPQKHPEVKDKMYPDINETIDMFEDKFDKIKRKCRSQAAAAKLIQTQVDTSLSYKNRKKSDKKKAKKSFKKGQNAVPTKGALKGFDGIKVSILTSDINMSAINPSVGNSFKKKRKNNSKKKRERKSSDVSSKSDSDHVTKESLQKKVDVYEFLDTEDTELFEFRPSTLMERFKSMNNKELPSTSKTGAAGELVHSSSDSASDGDDFVYMDDYIFSEDETENSVLSCELGYVKGNSETKKSSLLKRKDVIEKNAVMGKIFKHNAVRSDKKNMKHFAKPKANLDQLFDSLLENDPDEQSKDEDTPKEQPITYRNPSPTSSRERDDPPPVVLTRRPEPSMSVTPFEELISQRNAAAAPVASKYDSSKEYSPPAQAANFETSFSKYREAEEVENDDHKSKYHESSPCSDEDYTYAKHKSKEKNKREEEISRSTKRNSDEHRAAYRAESPEEEPSEEGGVARQRARRKCAVGKQNVLAETWSSESEQDNGAEAAGAAAARRRRPRKREVREASVRRATHRPVARTRPPPLCFSEGEDEPGHPQQHGWIVGDSHKKLVTMLAHAKGRQHSHDDRRPLLD